MTPRATFCSEHRQGVGTHRVVLLVLLPENFISGPALVCVCTAQGAAAAPAVCFIASPTLHGMSGLWVGGVNFPRGPARSDRT